MEVEHTHKFNQITKDDFDKKANSEWHKYSLTQLLIVFNWTGLAKGYMEEENFTGTLNCYTELLLHISFVIVDLLQLHQQEYGNWLTTIGNIPLIWTSFLKQKSFKLEN